MTTLMGLIYDSIIKNYRLFARGRKGAKQEDLKCIGQTLGIEGDYEGIGHCILGYAAQEPKAAAPRKASYIYRI